MVKQVSFRLTEEQIEKLNFVCKSYGISKTGFLLSSIQNEYDNLIGNKEALQILDKMKDLAQDLAELTGQNVGSNHGKKSAD